MVEHKRRIAEERLPCWRLVLMVETSAAVVTPRAVAISRRVPQNASSRLTLVLCPANNIPLFTMGDFFFVSCADPMTGDPPRRRVLVLALGGSVPSWEVIGQAHSRYRYRFAGRPFMERAGARACR